MLVGRLEIFTVLLLFHPDLWRRDRAPERPRRSDEEPLRIEPQIRVSAVSSTRVLGTVARPAPPSKPTPESAPKRAPKPAPKSPKAPPQDPR
jgi:hypothetical protein